MNTPGTEKTAGKPRILVAPLDWGLGHATRCIPLVHELIAQNCDVWLAVSSAQQTLLTTEFPGLPVLPLRGYGVKYARSARALLWQLLWQTPRLLRMVREENRWLQQAVQAYGFDGIISDNRYGLYHRDIPTVFITHQLTIKTPFGQWAERVLRQRNYRYIARFRECWVPDHETGDVLAGELSHPLQLPPVPVTYTGPLSRFHIAPGQPGSDTHLLFLLSGPEPQRTLLENSIISQVSHYNGTATIVRGLPGNASLIPSTNMLRFYNHLPAAELAAEIAKAGLIISRSGYSTVMDMAILQKKCLFIPTPGQTEQEYLARYLEQRQFAPSIQQQDFSLVPTLEKARRFTYRFPAPAGHRLKAAVSAFIGKIKR